MSNLVHLEPGTTAVFHTVFECRKKTSVDVQKINRGNFGTPEVAAAEKKRLEDALSPNNWGLDDEGRFEKDGATYEVRWFFVKRRKIFIQG